MSSPSPQPRNPSKAALLALAVASGEPTRAAAERLGIAERTAKRWASTPEFKAEVRQLRDEFTAEALGRLAAHAARSVEVLAELRDSEDAADTVRLMAARAILEKLPLLSEWHDLAERIARLEQQASTQAQREPEPWQP